jgi:magnesium transporter
MADAPSHPTGVGKRRAVVYRDGRLDKNVSFDQLSEHAAEDRCIVWLDVEGPSDDDLRDLQQEFSLHPLAVEDLRHPQQRPKVDAYAGMLLVVLFDVGLDPSSPRMHLNAVAIFVGKSFLITVHKQPVAALDMVRQRWEREPTMVDPSPLGFLLYRIASALVDGFFPVTDELDARVQHVEDRMIASFDRRHVQTILRLRRDLTDLRRAVTPQRDVFTNLARHDDDVLDAKTDPYFADVVDLVLRLTDTIDTTRDRLAAAFESQLTLQSTELNVTMKRLTGLTVVLMVPTLIAGIYGMNFHAIPLLDWDWGFWASIVVMVAASVACWVWFRRLDWL